MTDLVVIENPSGIDADIKAVLPATPTPGEALMALSIDDTREMHADRLTREDKEIEQAERQLGFVERSVGIADANKGSFERQAAAAEQLAEAWKKAIPPAVFDEPDQLFQRCVFMGVEARARNQTMGTTTSRETVMRDVIDDGWWIGVQLYNKFAADKGLPLKQAS